VETYSIILIRLRTGGTTTIQAVKLLLDIDEGCQVALLDAEKAFDRANRLAFCDIKWQMIQNGFGKRTNLNMPSGQTLIA
jgi:hypothetical protein